MTKRHKSNRFLHLRKNWFYLNYPMKSNETLVTNCFNKIKEEYSYHTAKNFFTKKIEYLIYCTLKEVILLLAEHKAIEIEDEFSLSYIEKDHIFHNINTGFKQFRYNVPNIRFSMGKVRKNKTLKLLNKGNIDFITYWNYMSSAEIFRSKGYFFGERVDKEKVFITEN